MADAAVETLIQYLREVQIQQADLIRSCEHLAGIDKLENELSLFRTFLRSTPDNQRQNDVVRRIRNVVYEMEDIINASMTEAADASSKLYFLKTFKTSELLKSISRQVDAICDGIGDIYGETSRIDFIALGNGDERPRLFKVDYILSQVFV